MKTPSPHLCILLLQHLFTLIFTSIPIFSPNEPQQLIISGEVIRVSQPPFPHLSTPLSSPPSPCHPLSREGRLPRAHHPGPLDRCRMKKKERAEEKKVLLNPAGPGCHESVPVVATDDCMLLSKGNRGRARRKPGSVNREVKERKSNCFCAEKTKEKANASRGKKKCS
ncbi:hypothetical protein JOB18_023377 [Solea senegalensis]|uniref:Uncharacterized protein n=1 Tax=Solea senegalensis TaxID=28829 RepID=A0AAV6S6Q3_SOLSE|nr:hypothetical protein JOB18_023377 [Solea senegalensis]